MAIPGVGADAFESALELPCLPLRPLMNERLRLRTVTSKRATAKQNQSKCTNIEADRMPSVQQNLETSTSVIAKTTCCRCGVLAEPGATGSDVSDVHECLHSPTNMVYKCRLVSLYFVFAKMLYARDRAIYPQPYSTNEKAQFVRKSATRLIFSMPCISSRLAP